jgi:hypothetical protein
MLNHFYAKPSTIDRIRNSWLGSQMDDYVGWMEANGYSSHAVFRRLPPLFCFAEFAQRRGCIDVTSALSLVDEFVSEWLVQHGADAKTSTSLRKHAIDIGNAIRQMLRLANGVLVRHNRHCRPFPLESEVPGFEKYLRSECGLMESTIHGYRHHSHEFGQYLRRAGITSLGDLSPALLASFIVEWLCRLIALSSADGIEMTHLKTAAFAGREVHEFQQDGVNQYPPGAGIGWHKDKPQFGTIVGISLLATATMRLRLSLGTNWIRKSQELTPRSIYILEGEAPTSWEHSVPPVHFLRYSLTFRTLAGG